MYCLGAKVAFAFLVQRILHDTYRSEEIDYAIIFLIFQNPLSNGTKTPQNYENVKSGNDKAEKEKNKSTWRNLLKYGRELWPYVWPSGNLRLQGIVIVSVAIILLTRLVNVLVPLYYKKIGRSFSGYHAWICVACKPSTWVYHTSRWVSIANCL